MFASSAIWIHVLPAQEEEEGDIFELSPFLVESDENVGYLATSTLAGTRIRSNLEDIATSISVVTEELFEDTNSTDALDILVYTTGTEVAGIGGNFTNFSVEGSGGQVSDEANRNAILAPTRIRGLAAADRARNYFRTSIPFDSYNTQRVEINRGSNAVLFGLGSPAGIINNSLKQAEFANSIKMGFTVSSYDSFRVTADINQEVMEDQLAVRVIAMHDDTNYEQEPAFRNDERLYGTARFSKDLVGEDRTWGNTTIRTSFEVGEQEANKPRTVPVVDQVTPWFTPYTVDVFGGLSLPVKPTWDAGNEGVGAWTQGNIQDPNNPEADNRRISVSVHDSWQRGPAMVFEGAGNTIPSDPYGDGTVNPRIIGRQGIVSGAVNGSTGLMAQPTGLATALRSYRGPNGERIPYASQYSTPLLSDPSVFDFRNILIDGPNKYETYEFEAEDITVEQLFFDGKAGIEIAYAYQEIGQEYGGRLKSGFRAGLTMDINTTLIDGTPNKNFGRPIAVGSGYWGGSEEDREDFRTTFFAEFDFTENENGIVRWLGQHTLTGLYSDSSEERFSYNGFPAVAGPDYIYGFGQSLSSRHDRRMGSVHYLGPSIAERSTASGADIPGIQVRQYPDNATAGDGLWRVAYSNSDGVLPRGEFRNERISLIENAVNSASRTSREIESLAFVLQSSLIKDILISTISWRQDDLVSKARSAPERDAANIIITDFDLIDEDPLVNKDSTWNYGGVLKTPESWLKNIPVISGLNFHYSESENFQPARSRFNPDGSLISSPTGETKDYGIAISLFDDKLVARATWYETAQVNVGVSGVGSLAFFADLHGRVLEFTRDGANPNLDPSDPGPEFDFNGDGIIDLDYQGPPQEYLDRVGFTYNPEDGASRTGGIPASAVQDLVTEGVEIEIVYNPTPNWNIMFNAFRQEATSSGAGRNFREFVETPAYDFDGDGVFETDWVTAHTEVYADVISNTSGQTMAFESTAFWFTPLERVEALDGIKNPELREWRFNAITNYRFTDGFMEGVNIGGALRWEDESAIGFGLTEEAPDEFVIDADKAFFGGSDTKVDAWIGYTTELMSGKVEWKIQLNVRNLLNDDDLVPIKANPDGSPIAWRIPRPREWSIRSTFAF